MQRTASKHFRTLPDHFTVHGTRYLVKHKYRVRCSHTGSSFHSIHPLITITVMHLVISEFNVIWSNLLGITTHLVAGQSENRGSISARGKVFFFFIFHILSERVWVYAVFYAMGASVHSSDMKWPRCEAHHFRL